MNNQNKPEDPKAKAVGYCNPPEHTRFKAGRSGNPKGRPKGTLNIATILDRTLREKVIVNENGRRKKVTKLEAAITQLMNKAASGDLKALQLLTGLVRSAEDRSAELPAADSVLDDVDQEVFLGILNRMEATHKKEGQTNAIEPEADDHESHGG